MKIFLDTASLSSIKKWAGTGLIDGVTTNPSHLSKEGGDPKKNIMEICALLPQGEISVEVTQTTPADVYKQAKAIAALSKNILVKIPCHSDYFAVIKRLGEEGIALNITLVFTVIQALMMAKLGVAYVSPFVGRWDDLDVEGLDLLEQIRTMLDEYEFETALLAASLRHVRHVHQAILLGADAITVPVSVFEHMITHPLTDQGITKFATDWQKLGITQFP